MLLIVAHALRHVQYEQPEQASPDGQERTSSATPLVLTPELVEALRVALAQVTISEEPQQQQLSAPQNEQAANPSGDESKQEANNYERVKAHLADHPEAGPRDIAAALAMSPSTAHKWRNRVKGEQIANECSVFIVQ